MAQSRYHSPVPGKAFTSSNILSVAATDYNDKNAFFQNYGAVSVDFAAPGVSIYSTAKWRVSTLVALPMATPHVSGKRCCTFEISKPIHVCITDKKQDIQ